MTKLPTVIYCCKGLTHLSYAIWSIRSLRRLGYEPIEVIVSDEKEKGFFTSHCPGIVCNVVDAKLEGYPSFSYKPFVLAKYLKEIGIQHKGRDIVVCDADILWKQDPALLLERFGGANWVHKITAVNPLDYEMPIERIPKSNIGLQTIQNYAKRYGVSRYPNFIVNAGLFMLPEKVFPDMLKVWLDKIFSLSPGEMLMSEALMSLTYAEMGLHPISDRKNIKYLGREEAKTNLNIIKFEIASHGSDELYTGYETAKHYYGDQRKLLHKEVVKMGIDHDRLLSIINKEMMLKKIKNLPKTLSRSIHKLKAERGNRPPVIYYVIDSKNWIQHKRYEYLMKFQNIYNFRLLTAKEFELLWRLRFLRKRPVFFSTWRIVHALIKADPRIFDECDFRYFMAAVTSHSNIGGGLDPLNPIPGRKPEEAFNLAVDLLKKFKVVSVNSMILYELLNEQVPGLMYCPNGVDTGFFMPVNKKEHNPHKIRIGWVGKERGPKNLSAIEKVREELEPTGKFKLEIVKVPKKFEKAPLSSDQMRRFYENIDFYLCASWNEGTPNPALEAASCGVPVITTRVGNMRELIKPGWNGFFVNPTAGSIMNQLRAISKMSPDKYVEMSRNMRESIVNDWSWQVRVKNFNDAFSKLISG